MKVTISKEDLYKDYVEIGMSTRDVAQKYNSSQSQVRRMLKYYDIPARKPTERTEYHNNKMRPYWDKYKETNRKWYIKTCEWCNKEFEITYLTKNHKFCSDECRKDSQKTNKKYYCQRCEKEIIYKNKVYPRKYCDDCFLIGRSETQQKRIITNCAYCGKELSIPPAKYEQNKNHYCNQDCMAKYFSEHYNGENSPAWKGGKGHHYQGDWYNVRKKARKRDNYTCQICGISENDYGQQMSVHHIKNYRLFDDKFEANNLDNLICLCEHCHRFVHSNENTTNLYIEK